MTQESQDIANTYQQITEAEKQASKLELMLDSFEAKLDSILKDAENINTEGGEASSNSQKKQVPEQQEKPLDSKN